MPDNQARHAKAAQNQSNNALNPNIVRPSD
jgi:hypothetical protein